MKTSALLISVMLFITITGSGQNKFSFNNTQAGDAIKEALQKGAESAVTTVSKKDGYFKNKAIKIPFPKELVTVEKTLRNVGAGSIVDKFVESLNRAAEDAAPKAKPILTNSIKQITVTDAVNIVTGSQKDAATQFLKRTTKNDLVKAFSPSVKASLDKVHATKYWKDVTSRYNKIPFVKPVNTDLAAYTTSLALDGLFYTIGKEEEKIRANPKQYGSDIITTVFGSVFQ